MVISDWDNQDTTEHVVKICQIITFSVSLRLINSKPVKAKVNNVNNIEKIIY